LSNAGNDQELVSLSKRLLRVHEGLSLSMYRCTAGKLTIGYGRNLEARGITVHEAEVLLETDVTDAIVIAKELAGDLWTELSVRRQAVLVDMAFNLGRRGLQGFRKMWAALRAKDFQLAAVEMGDSQWARQVGRRATALQSMMREG
jgi:lysozyme